MQTFVNIVDMMRVPSAVLPCLGLLVGVLVSKGTLITYETIAGCIVVICLNSVAMLLNDFFDRVIDMENGRPRMQQMFLQGQRGHVVVSMVTLTIGAFGLAATISPAFVAVCVVAGVGIWLYDAPPLYGSRRPVFSIILLSLVASALPFVLGTLLGQWHPALVSWAVMWWMMRASLSLLKDYKDAHGDAKHHKKTFLLVYGATTVARVSLVLFATSVIGLIVAAWQFNGPRPVSVFVIIMTAWLIWRRYYLSRVTKYSTMHLLFVEMIRYQMLLEGGMVMWLL